MGVEIRVPRLGWSMEEGTFSAWLAQAGSAVRAGQPLFCLEGEKATQDIESIGEGILHLAPDAPAPGQVVPVGKMIGMLCAAGEEPRWDSPAEPPSSPPVSTARTPMMPVASPAEAPTMPAAPPSVRRLARQMGVDLAKVKPSWPGGRIGQHDLQPISRSAPERPAGEAPAAITPRARRLAKNAGVTGQERRCFARRRDGNGKGRPGPRTGCPRPGGKRCGDPRREDRARLGHQEADRPQHDRKQAERRAGHAHGARGCLRTA